MPLRNKIFNHIENSRIATITYATIINAYLLSDISRYILDNTLKIMYINKAASATVAITGNKKIGILPPPIFYFNKASIIFLVP